MKRSKAKPETALQIYRKLEEQFGEVETPLHFTQDHELAIAVILSAQCTDERVNQVTPKLFQTFPNLEDFAKAKTKDIEALIFSTGFYHNKAKHIKNFAKMLIEEFGGKIPNRLEDAIKLPGFGRKTANVVLNELYGVNEGFVVDTHVKRLTNRLGLTKNTDPVKIEKDIMKLLPPNLYRNFSLYLIFLGRKNCQARRTECSTCVLAELCPSYSPT
ncbi:endonuclease III-like protein [Leptospira ryugenii]|uniref:Endonuclease III n=1 Tax=Leptospira ryugenii TaxID=1917863 RepID=A0A2P2DYV2_9LEPT|nr:endonuclease III-like protein [Leptospira ryugenii]